MASRALTGSAPRCRCDLWQPLPQIASYVLERADRGVDRLGNLASCLASKKGGGMGEVP
jgi:hypothetical protein